VRGVWVTVGGEVRRPGRRGGTATTIAERNCRKRVQGTRKGGGPRRCLGTRGSSKRLGRKLPSRGREREAAREGLRMEGGRRDRVDRR